MSVFYFVIGLLFQLIFYGNESLNVMALAHIILWPVFVVFWIGFYSLILGVALLVYAWFSGLFSKTSTPVYTIK